eukprot:4640790-Amphidinium_carterae.3
MSEDCDGSFALGMPSCASSNAIVVLNLFRRRLGHGQSPYLPSPSMPSAVLRRSPCASLTLVHALAIGSAHHGCAWSDLTALSALKGRAKAKTLPVPEHHAIISNGMVLLNWKWALRSRPGTSCGRRR